VRLPKAHLTTLALLPVLLAGCRELTEPKKGYIIVPHVWSPVTIRTKDLQGVGWLMAYTPQGQWEPILLSPGGSFTYQQVLPTRIWHCSKPDGSEGCVALLQAGDEKGYLGVAGRAEGKFHVCTENYVQRMGRKHCGERALERWVPPSASDPADRVELSRTATQAASDYPSPDALYAWKGDPWSRLATGHVTLPHRDTWNPPADDGTSTSSWGEHPYEPAQSPIVSPDDATFSFDLGACAIFFPWEWKDRIPNDPWAQVIGAQTGSRGFAEVLLDGILEGAQPNVSIMPDAFLYMDAITNVVQREDVSPELHVSHGTDARGNSTGHTEMLICLKNYFMASNDIQESPDAWYRWDQGIVSGFTSLFGIGDCRAHPASVFYCGAVDLDSAGKGRFRISSDVRVNIEGYSIFKPACNNQFIPEFKRGMQEGIRTVGERNLSDAMAQLVQRLNEAFGIQVRALQATPTGLYLVTARSLEDSQHGIGNCLPDLEARHVGPAVQPALTKEYGPRGITRF
jgi:hypothetical protein